jgi:hypothetical protein
MYKRQIPVEFRKNEGSANFFGQKIFFWEQKKLWEKKKFGGKKFQGC